MSKSTNTNTDTPNQKAKETGRHSNQSLAPVAVIIVNWNCKYLLERAISALFSQTILPDEVIVVDNASTDGSAKSIIANYPAVHVIESRFNLGFAAANNLAIQRVSPRCEWVAFLNPDALPEPDWLESLLIATAGHPDCAVFGSRLMDANLPSIIDGTGDVYHISGLVWRSGHGCLIDERAKVSREIFSPCAAAALFRKDALLAVGGFDEDFFCYVEDVDLGFRLRLLGYKCYYVPDSVALHVGSAVTGSGSDFSVYHGHRNLVWVFVKNMPGVLFWLLLPLHLALNVFSVCYFSFKGRGRVILHAKWDALKGLHIMWRKRREIQSRRVVPIREIWRILDKRLFSIKRC